MVCIVNFDSHFYQLEYVNIFIVVSNDASKYKSAETLDNVDNYSVRLSDWK